MILVNAMSFPGPALWQGLMLCGMPIWAWFALRNDGKNMNSAIMWYAVFGVVSAVAIILAHI